MTERGTSAGLKTRHKPARWAYVWWAATGALLSFGVASLLSIGIFLMPVALIFVVVGVMRPALRNSSAIAVIGGLAAAPLFIGWLNRKGPGTVCEPVDNGTRCTELWSPWPFVAAAVLLIAVSVALTLAVRRSRA